MMRMMLRWTVPVEKGNEAVDDGSMGTVIEALMARVQPEAAYFLAEEGKRAGVVFFQMTDSADLPRIAEILFKGLDASVEFVPVMNPEELEEALGSL